MHASWLAHHHEDGGKGVGEAKNKKGSDRSWKKGKGWGRKMR